MYGSWCNTFGIRRKWNRGVRLRTREHISCSSCQSFDIARKYATLLNLPVDESAPCACGREVATPLLLQNQWSLAHKGVHRMCVPHRGKGPNTRCLETNHLCLCWINWNKSWQWVCLCTWENQYPPFMWYKWDMKMDWICLFELPSVVWQRSPPRRKRSNEQWKWRESFRDKDKGILLCLRSCCDVFIWEWKRSWTKYA